MSERTGLLEHPSIPSRACDDRLPCRSSSLEFPYDDRPDAISRWHCSGRHCSGQHCSRSQSRRETIARSVNPVDARAERLMKSPQMNRFAQSQIDKKECRRCSTRLKHNRSTPGGSHDELTSVVEHSERESHLTPPLDALQWTIFTPVTIQHQNRQIKITSHPRPIDDARAHRRVA
jgi:hypothetical protein